MLGEAARNKTSPRLKNLEIFGLLSNWESMKIQTYSKRDFFPGAGGNNIVIEKNGKSYC